MNKQSFIEELKKGLAARGVADIGDIVSDYEEHFARKLADGYTEQEIAKKLGDPHALALEFGPEGEAPRKRAGFAAALGVLFLGFIVALLFVVAFAWAAAIAVGAFALALIGISLIASPAFFTGAIAIAYLPYVPGALMGVALIALALLLAVLAVYSFLLAKKSAVAYFRWQRFVLSGRKTPPYAVFPLAGNRGRRALRRVTVLSFALFMTMTTAAYIAMALMAGNPEFWHVWDWFGSVKPEFWRVWGRFGNVK